MTKSDDTSNEFHNVQYHTPGQLTTGKAFPLCMLLIPFHTSSKQSRELFASVETVNGHVANLTNHTSLRCAIVKLCYSSVIRAIQ